MKNPQPRNSLKTVLGRAGCPPPASGSNWTSIELPGWHRQLSAVGLSLLTRFDADHCSFSVPDPFAFFIIHAKPKYTGSTGPPLRFEDNDAQIEYLPRVKCHCDDHDG